MRSGGSPHHGHPKCPPWQHGLWTSRQTLAVVWPQTQAWPSVTAQAWISPRPQMAVQASHMGLFLIAHVSPVPPLSTACEPLCFSLSAISPLHSISHLFISYLFVVVALAIGTCALAIGSGPTLGFSFVLFIFVILTGIRGNLKIVLILISLIIEEMPLSHLRFLH